jgi:hypothetical protein
MQDLAPALTITISLPSTDRTLYYHPRQQHVPHRTSQDERPFRRAAEVFRPRPDLRQAIRNLDESPAPAAGALEYPGGIHGVQAAEREREQRGAVYACGSARSDAGAVSQKGVADGDGVVFETCECE